jgi:tetratricopeptide (TPR) repeat protein
MLALLLDKQKKAPEAQAKYEQIVSADPQAAVAANNLAWIYASKGQNLDVALQLAQTAKAKLPDSPDVSDTLGWVYYKKGLTTQAITALESAVAASPANPLFHYHLGMARKAMGDTTQARESLQKALSLAPDFDAASEARQALATLQQ